MKPTTYLNNIPVFTKMDEPSIWTEEIKKQGIQVNPDGTYKGEIKSMTNLIEAAEQIVIQEELKRNMSYDDLRNDGITNPGSRSFFDLTASADRILHKNIRALDEMYDQILTNIIFLPFRILHFCREHLETTMDITLHRRNIYLIKDKHTITVERKL